MMHKYSLCGRRERHDEYAVGAIVYIQDGCRPFGRSAWAPVVRRDPWQVVGWMNRAPDDLYGFRTGGHLAIVRSLRTGRVQTVADWILRQSAEIAA